MPLLPEAALPENLDLRKKCIVLHGPPKVGKSTALDMPGFKVLDLANRCGHLTRARVVVVGTAAKFMEEASKFLKEPETTLVIDPAPELWDIFGEAYCGRSGVKSMMDEKYKQGYGIVQNEIYRELKRLTNSGKGLWLICHSSVKPIEIPVGDGKFMTKEKWVPEGHDRVISLIRKLCYAEIFMEHIGGKRVMHPNASDYAESGTCLPMGSGKLPNSIEIPEGAYGYEVFEKEWTKATASKPS